MFRFDFFKPRQFAFGASDANIDGVDLIFHITRRFQQFFRALPIFFDFQKFIESLFAFRRSFKKNRGKSSLRNADGAAKKCFQIRSRFHAEMLPQKPRNFFFFIGNPHFQLRIVNVITCSRVAVNEIFAPVQTAFKSHLDNAFFRAAFDKIVFFVIEQIKQSPRDGFDQSRFSRAVFARNRRRSALKFLFEFSVRFNVFEFNFCDVHFLISDFRFRINNRF